MWIGHGLLVFLVRCVLRAQCHVQLSNRRLDSEAYAFLTLVPKAGYFVTTSNAQPQPALSCHKENKKAQKYIR